MAKKDQVCNNVSHATISVPVRVRLGEAVGVAELLTVPVGVAVKNRRSQEQWNPCMLGCRTVDSTIQGM